MGGPTAILDNDINTEFQAAN